MSVTTQSVQSAIKKSLVAPPHPIWRLSVDQYHEMIRAGILTEDDPVELLEGWLVPKMPKKPPHRVTTQLTREALARILPAGWYVDTQEPITTEDSEPEPDVGVVRGETRQYLDRHPGPGDVALVAEVSDATLQRDRGFKKRVYASASIPVYWIVNLIEKQCEVYTAPSGPTEGADYRRRQDYGLSDAVRLVIEGVEVGRIAPRELLP
ncbi:Uma2 family endonuclease [Candidatus Poribacteria bacterium]|nr:Uma2 family endonuclease [Candidatus Poribacteria bacterium]